jgi:hypothetical protein
MKERLKVGADTQTERTGVYHQYEYIDPAELRRDHEPQSDTQAVEDQGRAWYDGISPPSPPLTPAKSQVGKAQFGDPPSTF